MGWRHSHQSTRAGGWPTIAEFSRGAVIHVGDTAGVPQQLVAALRAEGVAAQVVVPPVPLARAPRALKIFSVPARLGASRRIAAIARRSGAPIVHVHYATAAFGYLGARIPLVVHAHGSDVRATSSIDRWMLGRVWRAAGARLVATPDLRRYVPGSIYLPNPVDLGLFEQAGATDPDLDVFVFAALTDVKGADRLVQAVERLRAQRSDVTVSALDGWPYSEAMRAAGATMVPRLAPSDVPAFIARHRVVLGQQLLGVLGVSELQAMASGRAVVTHLGPDADYGGAAPPVVEAHEPDEIASAALALLGEPLTAVERGRAGATWVRAHHDRSAVAKRLVEIYRSELGIDLPRIG